MIMIMGIFNKEAKVDERNCTCIQCTCTCRRITYVYHSSCHLLCLFLLRQFDLRFVIIQDRFDTEKFQVCYLVFTLSFSFRSPSLPLSLSFLLNTVFFFF